MKYTLHSAKYVLKNLLYLFPLAILPALFFSMSTDEAAIVESVTAFLKGNLGDWKFFTLFRAISILSFGRWVGIIFGLAGIIVIVPCVSLMMAMIEKHFRIGKRTFNGIWTKLNDNLLSTCGFAVLLFAIYEVWAMLTSALLFLASQFGNTIIAYGGVGVIFLVMHALLMYIVGTIYLWLPCMQITGFRAFEALQYSHQLSSKVKWRLLFSQLFFYITAEAALCVCAFLSIYLEALLLFYVFTTLVFVFLIMIFIVRMQVVYFDRAQLDRADLVKYYQR